MVIAETESALQVVTPEDLLEALGGDEKRLNWLMSQVKILQLHLNEPGYIDKNEDGFRFNLTNQSGFIIIREGFIRVVNTTVSNEVRYSENVKKGKKWFQTNGVCRDVSFLDPLCMLTIY